MESDCLLKETKAVLVLNLFDYIHDLIDKYNHTFIDPDPGIYLVGSDIPLLKHNQAYYSESSYLTQTPISSLDDVEEPILNQDGEIIIPKYIMLRKDKMLSSTPFLPVRAFQIVYALVQHVIDQVLPYTPAKDYQKDILQYVKPEFHHLVTEGYFESILYKLINDIYMFIGSDNWNIYYIKSQRSDLIIEKSIDYRVYDWTLQQEQQALEDTDD